MFLFEAEEYGVGIVVYVVFFFQAEDGIRDLVRSRGLGDVYKRQRRHLGHFEIVVTGLQHLPEIIVRVAAVARHVGGLSLIHI